MHNKKRPFKNRLHWFFCCCSRWSNFDHIALSIEQTQVQKKMNLKKINTGSFKEKNGCSEQKNHLKEILIQ